MSTGSWAFTKGVPRRKASELDYPKLGKNRLIPVTHRGIVVNFAEVTAKEFPHISSVCWHTCSLERRDKGTARRTAKGPALKTIVTFDINTGEEVRKTEKFYTYKQNKHPKTLMNKKGLQPTCELDKYLERQVNYYELVNKTYKQIKV